MSAVKVKLGPEVASKTEGDSSVMAIGTTFKSDGSWVSSPNREFILIMNADGNLVSYRVIGQPPSKGDKEFTGEPSWSTKTYNLPGATAKLQEDGNLVVYDKDGNAKWSSESFGIICLGMYLQDDGNLVIYERHPKWASQKS